MGIIDIVILILVLLAVIKGLKDGLVRQVGGIVGLVVGIILAGRFSALLSAWLHQWINASENIVKILSFALIIIGVCLCMQLVGKLLEKIITITTLGWVNKLLGAALSVFGVILLVGVLLSLISYVNESWFVIVPQDIIAQSKGVQLVTSVTDVVFPYIKEIFQVK